VYVHGILIFNMNILSNTHTTKLYSIIASIGCLSIGVLVYLFLQPVSKNNIVETTKQEVSDVVIDCAFRRGLDGICVGTSREQFPRLVGVTVENYFQSWPQSGIAGARVVYEAPVEGNITRFLLLFTEDQDIEKVGPVRSARPYYLDWLAEYGTPLYMHVGGSPAALDRITKEQINNVNEFNRGWYYWRDTSRYAPHNTYTSSNLWKDALDTYENRYVMTTFDGWLFGETTSCIEHCVSSVTIPYATGNTYTAVWTYASSTEQYLRNQAGSPDIDSNGVQIMADTIIVQYVDTTVLDSVGRLGMKTVGTGKSIVFQKGYAIEGTWNKKSVTEKTRFFNSEGEDVVLHPGIIWVQVVNKDTIIWE